MTVDEALRRHQIGDFQGAIAIYNALLAQRKSPEVAHNLAMAYSAAGLWKEAETAYLKAIKWDPKRWQSRNNLAIELQSKGLLFAAEAQWRAALGDHPTRLELHHNLGSVLYLQGRHSEAASLLYGALKENPIHAKGWFNLGVCLRDMGQLNEAAGCLYRSLEQNPNHAEGYLELGGCMLREESFAQALDIYRNGLDKEQTHPALSFHLGAALNWQNAGDGDAYFDQLPTACEPWLTSWTHLKSIRTPKTVLFGSMPQGMDHAIQSVAIDGLFIELGVRFGTSAQLISHHSGEPLHGFDTFEGLPEAWHDTPKASYSAGGYVPELGPDIQLYKGLFTDTLPPFLEQNKEPIALLHVDCDLYSSTISALNLLSKRLIPGSIVVFDEYYMNPHWQEDEHKAWIEFLKKEALSAECIGVCLHSYQATFKIR